MAWYNPQRVEYTPNAKIIESSGAIGNYLQNKAMLDYKQQLQDLENKRLADDFKFRQERAVIQDEQWDKDFQQNQDNIAFNQSMKVADFENNDYWKGKTFKQQEDEIKAKNTEEARKLKELESQNYIKGLYLAEQAPEFAQKVGAISTKEVFGKPQTYTKPNPLIEQIVGMSTPQQPNFLPQEQMSVPTYEQKTEYNPEIMKILGGSGITLNKDSGSNLKEVKAGDYTLLVDPRTGETVRKIDTTTDFTPTKIQQKYVQMAKAGKDISDSFNAIVDNYSTKFTGLVDSIAHDFIGQYVPWGNKEQAVFKSHMQNLTLVTKKLEEMGAAFSVSEQEMVRDLIGGRYLDDDQFKAKFITFMKIMRGKANSLIEGSDLAKYKTGDLKNILAGMDASIKNAEKKWGKVGVLDTNTQNDTWTSVTKAQNTPTTISVDDYSNYGISFE